MYENDFAKSFSLRLASLRTNQGVSARDMSLSIGQNPGYINNIESGKALPSMAGFFYICEFLHISPSQFFEFEASAPREQNELMEKLDRLSAYQINLLSALADQMSDAQL